ncbi:MAG: FliH/SctL family protein [Lachnospiraceae bacterium]|nr:FliH/SctL family protein [Lachnospiraceae bacterium]
MTRSLSNLLKSNYFVVNEGETRVINSNEILDKKLSELYKKDEQNIEEFPEDDQVFQEGIDVGQVDALLSEDGAESYLEQNVIKADPEPQGPTPEELLEQAQQQINEMMEQAKAEAEEVRQQAYEEGQREGYEAGAQELQQKAQEQERQFQERTEQLEKKYLEKQEELEPMFVDLITNIYEHIFHINLADFKEIIVYSIIHVIGTSDGKRDYIVRVSSADYEFVSGRRAQITEMISENDTFELVEDVTMSQGECMVETGGGIFDCGIDTQLKGLNKELKMLSFEKETK